MKKIVLIEDEEPIRMALSELLRCMDYQTIAAENGDAGLKLIRETRPDLVLCDVGMPEMDGHTVLQKLREDNATSAIPFIFLTGRGDKDDLRKGMNLGADDYLTKPVSAAELRNAISVRLHRQEEIVQPYTEELHHTEEKLKRLVYYDTLTELPNRLMIGEMFDEALKSGSGEVSVLCLMLDRFKRVNGSLGYFQGDFLLTVLAERLRKSLHSETGLVRLSEDEFVVLVNGTPENTEDLAHRLVQCAAKPFLLDSQEVYITGSVGISRYGTDGDQIDVLLKKAQMAVLQARQQGGNQYLFYCSAWVSTDTDDLILESNLRTAIAGDELEVFYQPQINLTTGRITGAEALLRWNHPTRGLMSPAIFIPIAEESGLIVPIGEWVLERACLELKSLQTLNHSGLRMAVNLSPYQFRRPDLVNRLNQIFDRTGVNPRDIELEVTESALIQSPDAALARMNELKHLGVQLSLDDFGTGYSSFNYLKQFPFDVLKIDRSFIRNVHRDEKNGAIASAMIQVAHNLNLKVIAEGIEVGDELSFLQAQECDEAQGYLFSPPLPVTKFHRLLETPDLFPDYAPSAKAIN